MATKKIPAKRTEPRQSAESSTPITLRLKSKMLRELDELARENGMARSGIIQLAVARLLKSGL